MGVDYDLVIRDGIIVDGNGGLAYQGDVGISHGRIAALGRIAGSGLEEIDAKGKLVTPGFVDIHSHYDGEALWDQRLARSAQHGFTTVLVRNCGVSFVSGSRRGNKADLIQAMKGGGISSPGSDGPEVNFGCFRSYLDAIERRARDVDVCVKVSHSAIRAYVMSERATRGEKASPTDVERMRAVVREAIAAGAFGVSTSQTSADDAIAVHRASPLPIEEEEILGLALGLTDAGQGSLEFVSDFERPDAETEFAMLLRIVERSRRPCLFSLMQRHDRPADYGTLLRLSNEARSRGHIIRPTFTPGPIGLLLGIGGAHNPFSGTKTYRSSIAGRTGSERLALMRRPEMRARILAEELQPHRSPLGSIDYRRVFPLGNSPLCEPSGDTSIAAIADGKARRPAEVAYDMMVAGEESGALLAILGNFADGSLTATREMLSHENALVGLCGGSRQAGLMCDGSISTFLLTWWGRDRPTDRLPVEELVRRLTSDPARSLGLYDRGLLHAGLKADINVIDFDRLSMGRLFTRDDLHADDDRLLQKPHGYEVTMVSGQITCTEGRPTQTLPGFLVRGLQPYPMGRDRTTS